MNQYRRGQYSNHQKSLQFFSNRIVWTVIFLIIAIPILNSLFFGDKTPKKNENPANGVALTLGEESSVAYIYSKDNKKTRLTSEGKVLFAADKYAEVERGFVNATLNGTKINIDANTQFSFIDDPTTSALAVTGAIWVDSHNSTIKANNLTANIPSNSIAIVEGTIAQGTVYAISGNTDIVTPKGQTTIKTGQMITIRNSDLENAALNLEEKIRPIDATLASQEIFRRNNGDTVLQQAKKAESEIPVQTASGAVLEGTIAENTSATGTTDEASQNTTNNKIITITTPVDGSNSKKDTITVAGTISSGVTRVTINEQEAIVSPVNETFSLADLALESGVNNIVYKAYDASEKELTRGVIAVIGPKTANNKKTIIPETINTNYGPRDFVITSPASNPYATSEDYIKVQGTVPHNAVQYITVNDYRLKEFKPNSTRWYYHASAKYGTMQEGANYYSIQFYDANNTLIHKQLLSIIKDSPKPVHNTNTTVTNEITLIPVNQ